MGGGTGKKKGSGVTFTPFSFNPQNEPENEQEEQEQQEQQEEQEQEPNNGLVNTPSDDENDLEGVALFEKSNVNPNSHVDKWFANPKLSNYTDWQKGLTAEERNAIAFYTGSGYDNLNDDLYNKPWAEMSNSYKEKASNLYNAINKFELNKAIQVSRATYLSYFGNAHTTEQFLSVLQQTGGIYQFNGFQSTSTGPKPAFGGDLIIHYTIPPSKGAGAYTRPISEHPSEREFTINTNAVVQFDLSSVKSDGYHTHVNAVWLGQAADQAFKKK